MKIKTKLNIILISFLMTLFLIQGCEVISDKKIMYLIPKQQFSKITLIEIENNLHKIIMIKNQNEWIFKNELNSENKKDNLKYLITALNQLEISDEFYSEKSFEKKFEIDKSKIKVTLYIKDKKYLEFIIGKNEPEKMKSYIKSGNKIYVVDRLLYNIFNIKSE